MILAADTGTTGHFVQKPQYLSYDGPLFNVKPATTSITVTLPDNSTMENTHEATLRLPGVSPTASKAFIFNDMASSLLSIGQLCDDGCIAMFDKESVVISKDNTVILQGKRNPVTKLWMVDLTCPPTIAPVPGPNVIQYAANAAIAKETVPERLAFLHWCAGSPQLSTWCKAIDAGYYRSWPGLTSKLVRKHMPQSIPMIKGHLDQQRKNIKSTKPKRSKATPKLLPGDDETEQDFHPVPAQHRTNLVYAECHDITGQIFSDQPGRFLVSSSSGNQYLMIVYDYDSNSILAEPMKSRSGPEMKRAYKAIFDYLAKRGFRPKLQRLDNEASRELKDFMEENEVDFQLTPTHSHRRNAAERAIRTFKNHFVAILCGTDPDFPLFLWDKLLKQAMMTLNFLRASRINPRLSAYEQLNGGFDFNRTPLGPLGCKVIFHEMPSARGSWSPHGVEGYYIGPAMEHYRCYKVWIEETRSDRTGNTLVWLPKMVPVPKTSSADAAVTAALDLIHALQHPHPASPLAPLRDEHRQAIEKLSEIFHNLTPAPASNSNRSDTTQTDAAPRVIRPTDSTQRFPMGTVIAKVFGDRNYKGKVVSFDSKYGYYKIKYEDDDVEEMNETEVGRHLLADPNAPLPQPQQPPRVAKPSTYAKATTQRRRARRSHATLPPSSTSNYYSRLTPDNDPVEVEEVSTDDATVVTSNRSTNPPAPRQRRRRQSPTIDTTPTLPATTTSKTKSTQRVARPPRRRPYHQRPYLPSRNHQAANLAAFSPLPSLDHVANAVIHPDTGAMLEYRDLMKTKMRDQFIQANIDEIGRLTDGRVGKSASVPSRTMAFVHWSELPRGKKATYLRIVADHRPQKANPNRVRWTAGGDKIEYPGSVSTPTAEMLTAKILFNSVISTDDARFMGIDISDFYLNSTMPEPEWMWAPVALIPDEVMDAYSLHNKVKNGKVLVRIDRGMYGLPQAGRLAYDQLVQHLRPYGYTPCNRTAGLWRHKTRPVTFCLTVDDFGVKYVGKENADHLIDALNSKYKITTDWDGRLYCGIQLDWNYDARWVDLSMPDYIKEMRHKFQHSTPSRLEHAPYRWNRPTYGPGPQLTEPEDDSPPLDAKGINEIQQIVGSSLYYGRAIDNTILPAITSLSSEQSKATERTRARESPAYLFVSLHLVHSADVYVLSRGFCLDFIYIGEILRVPLFVKSYTYRYLRTYTYL